MSCGRVSDSVVSIIKEWYFLVVLVVLVSGICWNCSGSLCICWFYCNFTSCYSFWFCTYSCRQRICRNCVEM